MISLINLNQKQLILLSIKIDPKTCEYIPIYKTNRITLKYDSNWLPRNFILKNIPNPTSVPLKINQILNTMKQPISQINVTRIESTKSP